MRVIPLGLIIGGWLSMPALAVEEEQWLERLVEAERHAHYSGTLVHGRAGNLVTYTVWQQPQGSAVVEHAVRLDGMPAEAQRVNGVLRCVGDEAVMQLMGARLWARSDLDLAAIEASYEIREVGESRVAGRTVQVLVLAPRDQHRYGFELYIDRQTGLLLKSLMLSEKGQPLERVQFTSLTPGKVQSSEQPVQNCRSVSAATSAEPRSDWRPEWLPAGFRLLEAGSRSGPVPGSSVDWLSYGDGLARFSVFLESSVAGLASDEHSQTGPTVAVSKRIVTEQGDIMATVVGEIPLGTAERVALSIRMGVLP